MNPSPHIQNLIDSGYDVEIVQDVWLLIKRVPYLNKDLEIQYGTIVSDIEMNGNDVKTELANHPIYFVGEQPYRIDGKKLNANNANKFVLFEGLTADFYFSYKLDRPYTDYYEKMSRYIHLFSKHAIKKDPSVTFNVGSLTEVPHDSPFQYSHCHSLTPEGNILMEKFRYMKVAIIGLGGTGSYILDFISKTPVDEIHLFDGDYLYNKNAFRAPGATSIDDLKNVHKKTDYFKKEYSRIHKNIISHNENIKIANLNLLNDMSFVFISIDKSEIKKSIVEYLEIKEKNFIDVGMGIQIIEGAILGSIRTTLSSTRKRNHVHDKKRIKFSENPNNEYSKMPQISELNALNASLAVIKWKKLIGFYHDRENEFHSQYILPNNKLLNNDFES